MAYRPEITVFALEWAPDSFPFRELCFALVSIASGKASFKSYMDDSDPHVEDDWAFATKGEQPIPFGTMFHRPGETPGASPAETIYWVDDVLVSLATVPDGESITTAVAYGVAQGRNHFQLVVLSLFQVVLAEVSLGDDNEPFVKVSEPINLSPLRMDYCTSSHPRERPELEPDTEPQARRGEAIMNSHKSWTTRTLGEEFRGCAALLNFFEVAGNRRATTKSLGRLPVEMYARVLDLVDYETWTNCVHVSPQIRHYCLRRFMTDTRIKFLAGPSAQPQESHQEHPISFDAEKVKSGRMVRMTANKEGGYLWPGARRWIPVFGNRVKTAMLDVSIRFRPEKKPVSLKTPLSDSSSWTTEEEEEGEEENWQSDSDV
jgi:hypothetical protein